jgi:hypothetical protein
MKDDFIILLVVLGKQVTSGELGKKVRIPALSYLPPKNKWIKELLT